MFINDASILSLAWVPAYNSPTGQPLREVTYDPFLNNSATQENTKKGKTAMWIETDDAHANLVNLANANRIRVTYTGHGYAVWADMIGGTDCFIKQFTNEKEATDYVKDLYQQLL